MRAYFVLGPILSDLYALFNSQNTMITLTKPNFCKRRVNFEEQTLRAHMVLEQVTEGRSLGLLGKKILLVLKGWSRTHWGRE